MRELALLQHIYGHTAALGEQVLVGPGDDMAVLRLRDDVLLVAVDQVAEGVHFDSSRASLAQIGRKAITRNLSDVAAMAAVPVAAVASAMLPRALGEKRACELFDAMHDVAREYGCPLIGGDVAMWPRALQISVTILAEPAGVNPVLRSGARPGDAVYVSGELGNAWSHAGDEHRHLDFEPRLKLGRALAERLDGQLHSMIDLSDGLGSDLLRICERSRAAAVLDVAALPARPPRKRRDQREPWQAALFDGEDYELCFSVAAEAADRVPDELAGVRLSRVGSIVAGDPGVTLKRPDGSTEVLKQSGWEHRS